MSQPEPVPDRPVPTRPVPDRPLPDRPLPARPHPSRPGPEPLLRDLAGAALRRARHDREMTLLQLAERSGVSLAYLSEIERGRKEASSEILADVCGALGLELSALLRACVLDLTAPVDPARRSARTVPGATVRALPVRPAPSRGRVDLMLAA